LPTNSENFGLTVLESLACSTPVIVTKAAPWSDLESYNAGWWIENGLEPLVEKLSDALSKNEIELKLMGKNGRKLVEDKFVWDKVSNDFFDVYSWLDNNISLPDSVLLK
jgi:glycosyltransferase involved in cell wall biosynthesis